VIGKTFVPVGENYKNAFKDMIAAINLWWSEKIE
jgi:hypothetical protein